MPTSASSPPSASDSNVVVSAMRRHSDLVPRLTSFDFNVQVKARPLLGHALESGEFDHLVDPRLERNYVESELLLMIEISTACVRHSSMKRPQMGQVIKNLQYKDGKKDMDEGKQVEGFRTGPSRSWMKANRPGRCSSFRRA